MARRLTRFARILGLLFLACGITWLMIWNQGGQAALDWMPLDLSAPSEARLMIVGGLLLLTAGNAVRLIVRLTAGSGSARAPKP
jgi:hypothetical protein